MKKSSCRASRRVTGAAALLLAATLSGCGGGGGEAAASPSGSGHSIVGLWAAWSVDSSHLSGQQFWFTSGGRFLMIDPVGDDEAAAAGRAGCGGPGLESGTYAWDASSGALRTTLALDTNGCAGTGSGATPGSGQATLTLSADGQSAQADGLRKLTRVQDSLSGSSPITGVWALGSPTGTQQFWFTSGGRFVMIDPVGDLGSATHASCGGAGIEAGTYAWNATTGVLVTTLSLDTNGCAGTSDVRSLQLTVAADGRSATVQMTDSSGASVLPIYRLSE